MSADRELLFGILALQNGLIDRDTLVAAFKAWMKDKSQPLAQVLQQRNSGSPEEFDLLNRLVELHINKNGQDPQQSLASLCNLAAITTQLQQLGDADINATLIGIDQSSNVEYSVAADLNPEQTFIPGKGQRYASGKSSGKSRFRILRPHARGGLGQVFVAQDEELNRNVALKEIQSQFADHPDSRSRFVLEAEVTGGLEHPGIVPVYGLGQYEDGRPYYAMRFIKGDSLKEAIDSFHKAFRHSFSTTSGENISDKADRACLPPTAFFSVDFRKLLGRFIDVCQAISYAHSRGVLHRDLKPGNVMLGKYGETLVVDWGLAKIQGRDEATNNIDETTLTPTSGSGVTPTVMGSAIGTPAYMPPEQAAGKLDELGPASDVYSLGATLYHLLTGEAPFSGKSIAQLLKDVQAGIFTAPSALNPGIPKGLEAVCLKAMSVAPGNRYMSPQNLADDIEKFLADEPVSAFAEPLLLRARRWVRKNQTLTTTTAAVVMVSAIGLGIFSTVVTGKNSELSTANQKLTDANAREREARTLAQTNERSAREQSQLALTTLTSVITDIQGGLRNVPGGGEVRRQLLSTSLEKLQSVSTQFVSQASVDHNTWRALNEMGDVILSFGTDSSADRSPQRKDSLAEFAEAQGNRNLPPEELNAVHLAASYYQRAFQIAKSLTETDPDDELRQIDLAISLENLGNVFLALGRTEESHKLFDEMTKIRRASSEADPNDNQKQSNLAYALTKFSESFARQGQMDEALSLSDEAMSISRLLTKADSEDGEIRVLLASAIFQRGMIFDAQLRLEDAMKQFQDVVTIRRALAESKPKNTEIQRDFAASLHHLVSVQLMLGRPNDALPNIEEQLKIITTLAKADPNNTLKQRDLSKSLSRIGDVYLKLGRLDDAMTSYQEDLEIGTALLQMDPGDFQNQREVSISFDRLGDVFLKADNLDEALTHFQESMRTCRLLTEASPNDAVFQHDLMVSHFKLGTVLMARDEFNAASLSFDSGAAVLRYMIDHNMDYMEPKEHLQHIEEQAENARLAPVIFGEFSLLLEQPSEQLPAFLEMRSIHFAKRRKFAEAAQAAAKLCELENTNPVQLYNAGWVFSQCASSINATDGSELSTEQIDQQTRWINNAITALQQCVAKGWTDFAYMEQDVELRILRDLPEFKALFPPAAANAN